MTKNGKDQDESGSTLLSTLFRQPLAFLGAIGLVSMLKGLITLHEDVLVLINAYQAVTQPIWDFLLGWLFRHLGWPFPSWAKDYLTMATIVGGAAYRAIGVLAAAFGETARWKIVVLALMFSLPWPVTCLAMLLGPYIPIVRDEGRSAGWKIMRPVFLEFLLWAAIIIALSYGLFFVKAA